MGHASRPIAFTDVIESHLEKIRHSGVFGTADGLRRLLDFVVREAVAGRGGDVKEYSLGVSVLGKGQSFDPKADPIVRVQMRRVREHLARYYEGEGRHDALIIDIPKGRYIPVFRTAPSGTDRGDRRRATSMVGHEAELDTLRSAFEAAAGGEGRMLCLAGEAGIGKTTIVETFLSELSTSSPRCIVARGACSERFAGSEAYLPVMEALDTILAHGARANQIMYDVAPTWCAQLSPGKASAPPAEGAVNGPPSQERLKRELVILVKALSRESPVVIFVDDLHWADPSTVDALAYLVPRTRDDRILVVGTYRPDDLAGFNPAFLSAKLELQAHAGCRETAVRLLSPQDVDRCLDVQFPDHRFPSEFAMRLHARSEGNPLFLGELLRFLRDRGVIARAGRHWILDGDVVEVDRDLPESLRSLVQKKIASLDEVDCRLLEAAAIAGYRFETAVVAQALGMKAIEVEDRLDTLHRARGFVYPTGDRELPDGTSTLEYRFAHILYQNALHMALTPSRRISLSLAVADATLARHGRHAGDVSSQLAYLFEAARDFARASDFFLLASRNASRMRAAEQAIALARRSAELAERLEGGDRWTRVAAAAMQSASEQQSLSRLGDAIADFARAARAASEMTDAEAEVDALFGQAAASFLAKRIPDVRALGLRAMEIARRSNAPRLVAASETMLALERSCLGDVPAAEERFDRAIPVLIENGSVPQAIVAMLTRGVHHTWHLEHRRAEELLGWAHGKAREGHASFELVVSLWHGSRARGNQGRISEAWDMLEEAMRLAELLGDRYWRPRIANTRGWLLAVSLDTEAALRLDTEAVALAREVGDAEAECHSHMNAAHDYLVLGDADRAWHHLNEAEARYRVDEWYRWVSFPRLQAEFATYWLAREDLTRARACAHASLASARQTSSRKRVAEAHQLLGEILMREDRPSEARAEFQSALGVLADHRCPSIEWQILRAAAGPAKALDGDEGGREMLARAGEVATSLAGSIRSARLRRTFLNAQPVRELFAVAGH